MTVPADVLEAATAIQQGQQVPGFTDTAHGVSRTVWLGREWVIKVPHAGMAAEYGRWRRSPADEATALAALGKYGPLTVLHGDVLIQERLTVDPHRAWECRRDLTAIAAALGVPAGDRHPANVGWRGDAPVFFDVEYLGPPLTVVLLLKVATTRGRAAQGEAPFWPKHGRRYLEAMVRNVRQHLPTSTRVVVMTDRPEWVPAGCDIATLSGDQPGWWAKLNMFRRDVTCGRCLYLDLDNVLAAPIPELLALEPDPVIMLDDRYVPGLANSSTLLYVAERCRFLWDRFVEQPAFWMRQFSERVWPMASDQAYTAHLLRAAGHRIPFFQDLLPEGYVVQSKIELEAGAPWEQARLVFGCWTPKPHESKHQFYRQHWSAAA